MNKEEHILSGRIFISALVLVVVALSFFIFGRESLRLDEAQSLWQASHTPLEIIRTVAQDVHVPLYHLILHSWMVVFGNSVSTARLLSLILFILMLPALYYLGRITYGRFVGYFAALLVAISPFFNWYGNEIRMYSLFTLITILNQIFFIKLYSPNGSRKPPWGLYTLTALLGIFTHYFFIFLIVTQGVFFILYRRLFPPDAPGRLFNSYAILASFLLPWVAYVGYLGGAERSEPLLEAPTSINLFNAFSQFIFGFQGDFLNTVIVSLWPLVVLLIFFALQRGVSVSPHTVYFFLTVSMPIFLVFLVSAYFKPIFLTRYLIFTLPSFYLVMSSVLGSYPPKLSRFVKVSLVLIMLGALGVEAVSRTNPVRENYREAAEYLMERAAPQDIIVVSAPFTIYPVEYYYRGPADIETLPRWDRFSVGAIPAFSEERLGEDVEAIRGRHNKLWLLLSYDQGYEEALRLYFDTNFEREEVKNFSQGLNLYAYKLRYDDEFIKKFEEEFLEDLRLIN